MTKTFLGADLGGTKLMIGEMDADGRILRHQKYPSGYLDQRGALDLIQRSIDDFLAHYPDCHPSGIGVGLLGRVDNRTGTWLEIDHDRGEPFPAAAILSERYGIPAFLDNDVRSATKAEMLFGHGRGSQNWIYLNVGTGIAAGIVTGGRLVTGSSCNSGEVGHTTSGIAFSAPCSCGRTDCVEPVASGMGLALSARLLAPEYPDTQLHIPEDGSPIPASAIFALYGTDPLCTRLIDQAAQGIANLIMNLVRFCDPDTIVLGGGLMAGEFLYQKVLERLNPFTIRYVTGGIIRTALDPQFIGLLGACSNAVLGVNG